MAEPYWIDIMDGIKAYGSIRTPEYGVDKNHAWFYVRGPVDWKILELKSDAKRELPTECQTCKLFKVSFLQRDTFSANLSLCIVLSVGANEKDAIDNAKTLADVPSDARGFMAEAIDTIMEHEVRCFSKKTAENKAERHVFRVYYQVWSNQFSRVFSRMAVTLATDAADAIHRIQPEGKIPDGAWGFQAVDF